MKNTTFSNYCKYKGQTIISKYAIHDRNLSNNALGLLVRCLSYEPNRSYPLEVDWSQNPEGDVFKAFQELKRHGYCLEVAIPKEADRFHYYMSDDKDDLIWLRENLGMEALGEAEQNFPHPPFGATAHVYHPNQPRNINEVIEFFHQQGKTPEEAETFFNYYEAQGWLTGGGVPITNWRAKANSWSKNKFIPEADKPEDDEYNKRKRDEFWGESGD